MKKIFIFFILLLLSFSVQADEERLKEFDKWLIKNKFSEFVDLEFAQIKEKCKSITKYTNHWYYNKCDKDKKIVTNYKVNTYNGRSEIPEKGKKPNYETLLYYFWEYTTGNWTNNPIYRNIKPSDKPYEFKFDLREDELIKKQMQKTALLSYLLYENEKIVIDEISSKDKFGGVFTNETKYHSQSVGKSFASYILGHAICKGYVGGIDAKLNDWPVLENTLYHNQKIIDLINMKAGDAKYFSPDDSSNKFKNSSSHYSVTNRTIPSVMMNELNNSKKSGNKWAYNNLLPHIIMNYMIFKAGEDGFKKLLDHVFREKAGIGYNTILVMGDQSSDSFSDGSSTSTFLLTRYDYLRIARAMLQDWQNDTCEGKYLKSIFERKVKKKYDYSSKKHAFTNTKSYGGFFHLEPSGMKKRHIFVMDGYGGQTLTIDFDKGRIVTTMAIHRDFNWMKIAHSVIKKGK
jgi:CubicO group peptidase (beta-lactamase class C family)